MAANTIAISQSLASQREQQRRPKGERTQALQRHRSRRCVAAVAATHRQCRPNAPLGNRPGMGGLPYHSSANPVNGVSHATATSFIHHMVTLAASQITTAAYAVTGLRRGGERLTAHRSRDHQSTRLLALVLDPGGITTDHQRRMTGEADSGRVKGDAQSPRDSSARRRFSSIIGPRMKPRQRRRRLRTTALQKR